MSERHITLWRKTGEQCLDWDFHVSDFPDELPRLIENLKKRGVVQYTTYELGPQIDEHTCGFAKDQPHD